MRNGWGKEGKKRGRDGKRERIGLSGIVERDGGKEGRE